MSLAQLSPSLFVFIFESHFQFLGRLYFISLLHILRLLIFCRHIHLLKLYPFLRLSWFLIYKPKLVNSKIKETIITPLWNESKLALSLAQLCPSLFSFLFFWLLNGIMIAPRKWFIPLIKMRSDVIQTFLILIFLLYLCTCGECCSLGTTCVIKLLPS